MIVLLEKILIISITLTYFVLRNTYSDDNSKNNDNSNNDNNNNNNSDNSTNNYNSNAYNKSRDL